MSESTLKLIVVRSKFGDSLHQISELTNLTEDQVKERLGKLQDSPLRISALPST
jgi:hypothetical protein